MTNPTCNPSGCPAHSQFQQAISEQLGQNQTTSTSPGTGPWSSYPSVQVSMRWALGGAIFALGVIGTLLATN